MLTLEQCKKALGDAAKGLTDDEILHIRDLFWELIEIAYETKIKPPEEKAHQKDMTLKERGL